MTLYIYRVGWTCPARNSITRSKSIKISSCARISLVPVRPIDSTGQTDQLLPDQLQRMISQTARTHRSDRSKLYIANFNRQRAVNRLGTSGSPSRPPAAAQSKKAFFGFCARPRSYEQPAITSITCQYRCTI